MSCCGESHQQNDQSNNQANNSSNVRLYAIIAVIIIASIALYYVS
ncbi:hypothetical protein [Petroclostridium sp. X23]|nr:hypothetical protein [Petroclostridium sp. X23]WHH60138.1 hypothetical protein QKW49_05220 [Petroclostridium sp. X23]